jgi:hypothetical protein
MRIPWNKNPEIGTPYPGMKICQYCAKEDAYAYLISSCPEEHIVTIRICIACYHRFLANNVHMCLNCNRAIMDWAAKLDQGKNLRSGVWITSWGGR